MRKNNSLAYLHGKSTHSLGNSLTPNLNVEDEYIENLLKQIQFMSLEIKLMKEKQSHTKSSAVMGLINKEQKPVIDHLLVSNEKYKSMKEELSRNLVGYEAAKTELESEERGLVKKREYIDRKRKEAEEKNEKHKVSVDAQLNNMMVKLSSELAKKEQLLKQNSRLAKAVETNSSEYNRILTELKNQEISKEVTLRRFTNQGQMDAEDQAKKKATIQGLVADILGLKTEIENDQNYAQLDAENKKLLKELEDQEKLLSNLEFEFSQNQNSLRLAKQMRDKQITDKKKVQEEFEKTERIYTEVKETNEAKIQKKKKMRIHESRELRKAEANVAKLEKDYNQAKKRFDKAEETYKKYRCEQAALIAQETSLRAQKKEYEEKLAKLTKENSQKGIEVESIKNALEDSEKAYQKLKRDREKLSLSLLDVEEEYSYVHSCHEFLINNVSLQQDLKAVGVEELRNIVQKNNDMNDTVKTLMEKWTEIQSFSRT